MSPLRGLPGELIYIGALHASQAQKHLAFALGGPTSPLLFLVACALTMSTLGLTRFRAGGSRVVLRRSGARTFFASPSVGKQRLVILGSGWGGYEILRAIDKKRWSEE